MKSRFPTIGVLIIAALWAALVGTPSVIAQEKPSLKQLEQQARDRLEADRRRRQALEAQFVERQRREAAAEQYDRGLSYYNDLNYTEAAKWFRLAADQGNATAQYSLGLMYRDGDGVEKDLVKAAKLLGEAADAGSANAQNDLGVMYLEGEGVKKDWSVAMSWFQKSAEQGNAVAALNLARQFYFGQEGKTQDLAEAKRWAKAASDKGDTDGKMFLATLYLENGESGQAEGLLRDAVASGSNDASLMLGVLLMQREEYAESYKLLNRLSENGDASASAWVGVLYADQKVTAPDRVLGQTVRSRMFNRVGPSASGVDREAESNFRAACLLFAKAYQANDILGGAMLSDCFLYGRDGRTRDAQRALEILKSLEARDDIRGHLLETAILYSYGEVLFAGQEFGMQRDLAKARSLWQRLLEVAPDGDENVPYAQAGLACIDQKKASKNCVALRCSIEGGTNCSAP